MAKYDNQLQDLRQKIDQARKILILLPSQTTIDKLAAALSLMLSLEKQEKDVIVVTEDTLKVSHSSLYGVGQIKNTFPPQGAENFILTLGGVVDQNGLIPSLEKLDWYPDNGNLNLVFHVVPGFRFEPTNISSSYQGSKFDLAFIIGAVNLTDLGSIYTQNSAAITQIPLINIDNSTSNANFGLVNVIDPNSPSLSEVMIQIQQGLGLTVDADAASNVIAGIYDATGNLTKNVSPDTFMVLAQAMQLGGRVISAEQQPQVANNGFDLRQLHNPGQSPFSQDVQPAREQSQVDQPAFQQPQDSSFSQWQQQPQNIYQPEPTQEQFVEPQIVDNIYQQTSRSTDETPSGEFAVSRGPEGTEFATGVSAASQQPLETNNPAPDWLTPKIYRGGGLG